MGGFSDLKAYDHCLCSHCETAQEAGLGHSGSQCGRLLLILTDLQFMKAHLHITSFQPQNNCAIIAVCSQGWTLRLGGRRDTEA